jgi:hypothetical protein
MSEVSRTEITKHMARCNSRASKGTHCEIPRRSINQSEIRFMSTFLQSLWLPLACKIHRKLEVGGCLQPGNRFVLCRACVRACVRARVRACVRACVRDVWLQGGNDSLSLPLFPLSHGGFPLSLGKSSGSR